MALVKRSDIQIPDIPREVEPVPELGGSVILIGLSLTDRLANDALSRLDQKPGDGETVEDAHARAGAAGVLRVLSKCVLGEGDQPLMNQSEWNAFGTKHPLVSIRLFNRIQRLDGVTAQGEAELEKNS
ncbi:hypothetical protein [Comamonas sp. BIGb0124]|uniref:hypothetical protein n=1 Tax=Comamonas sp. BIGb0124 TaxID=2485130 RepID=UPI000F4789F5|nr:hypothetical protein [Comamonas sp. BIGb0124]